MESNPKLAECDCDEQKPDNCYVCEECNQDIVICGECSKIIDGCECGHCPEGATFHES